MILSVSGVGCHVSQRKRSRAERPGLQVQGSQPGRRREAPRRAGALAGGLGVQPATWPWGSWSSSSPGLLQRRPRFSPGQALAVEEIWTYFLGLKRLQQTPHNSPPSLQARAFSGLWASRFLGPQTPSVAAQPRSRTRRLPRKQVRSVPRLARPRQPCRCWKLLSLR